MFTQEVVLQLIIIQPCTFLHPSPFSSLSFLPQSFPLPSTSHSYSFPFSPSLPLPLFFSSLPFLPPFSSLSPFSLPPFSLFILPPSLSSPSPSSPSPLLPPPFLIVSHSKVSHHVTIQRLLSSHDLEHSRLTSPRYSTSSSKWGY